MLKIIVRLKNNNNNVDHGDRFSVPALFNFSIVFLRDEI